MQGSSPVLLLHTGSYMSLITGCMDSVEWNGGLECNKLDTSDWFNLYIDHL